MNFLKSTLLTFVTNIVIFLISFLTTILTSRILGPSGKGLLGVSNNIIAFSLLILSLGIESSNVYYIGKDNKNADNLLGLNFIITIFSTIALLILYFLNLRYHFGFFKGLTNKVIIIIFSTVIFSLFKSYFISILLGLQKIVTYNKINFIDRIITFTFLLTVLFYEKSPYLVIVSGLIANIVVFGILIYEIFFKSGLKIKFKKELSRDVLSYGIKNQLGNLIQMLNYRLDIFIINYFMTVAQVGLYSSAVAIGETIWQISSSIATVVYPMTANSKDQIGIKDFINKVTRITFMLGLISCIILVLICKPLIVLLFGNDFKMSATALLWLLPGISIFSVSKVIANYLAGIGQVHKNIIASTVSGLFTVIFDFILIPKIGIIGASLATSGSYILFTIIILIFYTKITDSKWKDILIIKKDDIIEIKSVAIRLLKKKFR